MTRTLTVEADVNSADTRTSLTGQGSVTAPSLVTPSGVSKIDKIIASWGCDNAGDGDAGFMIRLGGSAVLGGEQVIAIGAGGGTSSTTNVGEQEVCHPGIFILEDVDIAIQEVEVITIAAEMCGDDLGDSIVSVTLVFA